MSDNYSKIIESLESPSPSKEALEYAADAVAFAQALHQMFSDTGMTTKENPDLDELENLVDALSGELAAACIFLAEPSFTRVPDMLRVVSDKLALTKDSGLPKVVILGYSRLAKRIENTRKRLATISLDNEKDK